MNCALWRDPVTIADSFQRQMEAISGSMHFQNPFPPLGRKPRPALLIIPESATGIVTPKPAKAAKVQAAVEQSKKQTTCRALKDEARPMTGVGSAIGGGASSQKPFGPEVVDVQGKTVNRLGSLKFARRGTWHGLEVAARPSQPDNSANSHDAYLDSILPLKVGKAASKWAAERHSSNSDTALRRHSTESIRSKLDNAKADLNAFLESILGPFSPASRLRPSIEDTLPSSPPPRSHRICCHPGLPAVEMSSLLFSAFFSFVMGTDENVDHVGVVSPPPVLAAVKVSRKERATSPVSTLSPYASSGSSAGTPPFDKER
eukprot:TRINITY_DN30167_c0_g1_i1.p1 TRINITY_DN30167_c0_g1~~TRINITY_DN30167_c0_g1_i1.p1  ORF type:complete len:317 (+),score=44.47 TRINITY_DN30167_c0_g1_i1:808-1758(+)